MSNNPQVNLTGLAWLLPSPTLRQRFAQHSLPIPTRLPVRWVRPNAPGRAEIQLPGAIAKALQLPSSFITVQETQLRPASSIVLWSTARSTVRRSVGAIG
jgi:hypothetical protein